MVKKIAIILTIIFLAGCLETENYKIITSNYPIYEITKHIENNSYLLLPKNLNGHYYEPTIKDIEKIENAEIFIYSGPFEPWVNKTIDSLEKKPIVINAGKNIDRINDGQIDPHIWLSPKNAITITKTITQELIKANPEKEKEYLKREKEYIGELEKLDKEYKSLKYCKKKKIFVSHKSLGYLARDYGLEQVPIIDFYEPNEADVSIKHINEIINMIKEDNATAIFNEEYINPKLVETIAEKTGVKIITINTMEIYNEDMLKSSYIEIMRDNLKKMKEGLDCD